MTVQVLGEYVTQCSGCGAVRDGDFWRLPSEPPPKERTTHGMCSACIRALYPEVAAQVLARIS